MSRYNFEQDPSGEPYLYLQINTPDGPKHLRLDYETTSIFTHRAEDSHYDHIFIEMDEGETEAQSLGAFIWRQVLPDWEDLRKELQARDFTQIHRPYPAPQDREAYERSGLIPPHANFMPQSATEAVIIEEEDDERVAREAVAQLDAEWAYYAEEWSDDI
jgi:hypothetical protein